MHWEMFTDAEAHSAASSNTAAHAYWFAALHSGSAALVLQRPFSPYTFTKSARAMIIASSGRISDALPSGGLWYTKVSDAVDYAKFYSRSHDAVIRVYDDGGNVIETHEHKGDFKEW
ncbi:MAG TPA: hypothetical protein VGM66_01125 [Candidatus Udaeobacter sp.]|jgi:hypothetical protein